MVTTSVENLAHHDNKTMKSGCTFIYKQNCFQSSSCRHIQSTHSLVIVISTAIYKVHTNNMLNVLFFTVYVKSSINNTI